MKLNYYSVFLINRSDCQVFVITKMDKKCWNVTKKLGETCTEKRINNVSHFFQIQNWPGDQDFLFLNFYFILFIYLFIFFLGGGSYFP